MIPQKRTFATLGLFFSGVSTWLIRRAMLEWGLSLPDVLQHPATLAYLASSFLLGIALMYYYDSDTNHKLHTIIMRGIQLSGILLVFYGTHLPELALAALLLLLLARSSHLLRWGGRSSFSQQPHVYA